MPSRKKNANVTHSMGHYLMAVRDQLKEAGYARVTDIASRMEISRSSVSVALASLRDKGYLIEDANHFFKLTEAGEAMARQVLGNQLLLETFFEKVLDVNEKTAMLDACKIEHLLSPETSRKLLCMVRYLVDHEMKLEMLQHEIRNYRQACPRYSSCQICMEQDECPFFTETLKKES
ncbi:MAG: metal-dependent transcriptional regulator [bacterium]|jgi:Mn-dependent DtxR family transcriptional regulator|nr:metal-dependent transcriptional regulator [bacterium]